MQPSGTVDPGPGPVLKQSKWLPDELQGSRLRPEGAGRASFRVPVGGDDPVHLALTLVPREGAEEVTITADGHITSLLSA
jgi:hypothetical protein